MQQKPYQIKEKLASSTHVLLLTLKKGFMYFIFFACTANCKNVNKKESQQILFYTKAWLVAFINTLKK